MADLIECQGCGAVVPAEEGPTHSYLLSAPACWRLYGTVLARRMDARRSHAGAVSAAVDRLPADAYAVQHPGVPGPRANQSVITHLVALGLMFEREATAERATAAMAEVIKWHKGAFPWLDPPASMGELTVADVTAAPDPARLDLLIRRWAKVAWLAWAEHHRAVREFYPG